VVVVSFARQPLAELLALSNTGARIGRRHEGVRGCGTSGCVLIDVMRVGEDAF
jgi:hypothetical protein